MNSYNYYTVDGQSWHLKKCETPDCPRLTTALNCCGECSTANAQNYEIHEDGLLGHSESCNERHEKRQHLKPF